MSLVIGTSQHIKSFHDPDIVRQGGITALMASGSVIGAIMTGPIFKRVGRRDSLFAYGWWLSGTILQVADNGEAMLIVGHILNGVCVGITSSQVPVYLAKIAWKENHGSILCI